MDGNMSIHPFDARRGFIIFDDEEEATQFAANDWVVRARQAISNYGSFAVALSGGNTPKKIYQLLSLKHRDALDWEKVWLFWSDERPVPFESTESNYGTAMQAGLKNLPIPSSQIFPIIGTGDLEKNALEYEKILKGKLPRGRFDLMMLGMGDDGHTASLFPKTHGLHAKNRLAIANFLPEIDKWRMSLTFDAIELADHIIVYVFGKSKAEAIRNAFLGPYQPDLYPIQRVGTREHPALFIFDKFSAQAIASEVA